MNSEPAGAVNTFGDQLLPIGTWALPITKPPAGNALPSEQAAQAASCAPRESAAVEASSVRRQLRRDLRLARLLPRTVVADVWCDVVMALFPGKFLKRGRREGRQARVAMPTVYRSLYNR